MKTVGIIGGLGPETTAQFFMRIVSLCQKKNKLRRPEILIINVPISFSLEQKFIKRSQGKREFRSLLINTAQKLEKDGADFIVIPCNTAHIFISDIRKVVTIPVLSIVDESIKTLRTKEIKQAGLLATPATIKNNLFANKIKVIKPGDIEQKEIGDIICKILNNEQTLEDKLKIIEIIKSLPRKPNAILLACTDLQLIIPERKIGEIQIFDTMEILANATTREIFSR